MDDPWWQVHYDEVVSTFTGARFCVSPPKGKVKAEMIAKPFHAYGNSGAGAIAMAHKAGAKRVILLGYDCQHTGGKAHWHGDHPRKLGNAGSVDKWKFHFRKLAKELNGIEIVNATRQTALEAFPRVSLEDALCMS